MARKKPKPTRADLIPVRKQAELMAEHIKQSGQTVLHLFPDKGEAREFNSTLLHLLSEEYTTPEGWRRYRLPERYTIIEVDPSEYRRA